MAWPTPFGLLVTRMVTIAFVRRDLRQGERCPAIRFRALGQDGQFIDVLVGASATRTRPAGSSRER
jgi:hypothetical protein